MVKYISRWSDKLTSYDIFYDSFSDTLIFHKSGVFILKKEYEEGKNSTVKLNLGTQ